SAPSRSLLATPLPPIHPLSPCSTSVLFFCFDVYHRDLHSFPTRRSSDLIKFSQTIILLRNFEGLPFLFPGKFLCHFIGFVHIFRSEEHTSELQSRENLVCRLLLEKKKVTSSPGSYTLLQNNDNNH